MKDETHSFQWLDATIFFSPAATLAILLPVLARRRVQGKAWASKAVTVNNVPQTKCKQTKERRICVAMMRFGTNLQWKSAPMYFGFVRFNPPQWISVSD